MSRVGPLSLALVAAVVAVTILPTVNGCAFLATWRWDTFDVENVPRPKPVAKKRALPVAKIELDDMKPNIQNLDKPHVRKKRTPPLQETFETSVKQQAARLKSAFHDDKPLLPMAVHRDRRAFEDDAPRERPPISHVESIVEPKAVHRDRRNYDNEIHRDPEMAPEQVHRDRRDYESEIHRDPEIVPEQVHRVIREDPEIVPEQIHRDRRDYEGEVRPNPEVQILSEPLQRDRRTAEDLEQHVLSKSAVLSEPKIENVERQRREEPEVVKRSVQHKSYEQPILSEYAGRERREPAANFAETAERNDWGQSRRADTWNPERRGYSNDGYAGYVNRYPRGAHEAYVSNHENIFGQQDDPFGANTGYKYHVYAHATDDHSPLRGKRQAPLSSDSTTGEEGGGGGGDDTGDPKITYYTCDQATLELSCPAPKRLKIVNTIYGRERSDTTHCPHGNTDVSTVSNHPRACERHVEPKVKEMCHNKQSCSFIVMPSFFNLYQLCPDITKYLKVEYICTERQDDCCFMDGEYCGQHGSCVGNACRCKDGWRGECCEEASCDPPCENGGTCENPEYPCTCLPGWQGYYCQNAVCENSCGDHGLCTAPNHCTCDYGYTGPTCNIPICNPACLNGGACTGPDECTCVAGWTGEHCESAICYEPCQNGGICNLPNLCTCPRNYAGRYCEIPSSTNSTLNIHKSQDHRGRYATVFGRCGQTNLVTIDGVMLIDFPGDCEYIFACDDILNIQIFVKREPCDPGPPHCYRSARIVVTGLSEVVYLRPHHAVFVGDKRVGLPGQEFGITFEQLGDWICVTTRDSGGRKMQVWYDGYSTITVEPSDGYMNRISGLIGSFNMNPEDDLVGRNGHPVHGFTPRMKAISYFEHWRADIACPSVPLDAPGSCSAFSTSERDQFITECHDILNSDDFSPCHDVVDPLPYVYACLSSYCQAISHGRDKWECICDIFTKYSQDCAHSDRVIEWRRQGLCQKSCASNFEFMECGSACPKTCKNINTEEGDCKGHCVDGCHCPEGLYRDGDHCVPYHNCSCTRDGMGVFSPGESFQQDCNRCYCTGGQWECTQDPCPATCSLYGGVHLQSFDGKRSDFFGQCQYVFAKDKGWNLFTVLVQQTECQTEGDTCTESVTLIIGNVNDGEVITFHQDFRVVVGNMGIELPHFNDLYHIRHVSGGYIQLRSVVGVKILWNGFSILMVEVDPGYMGNTLGLCGVYDGNQGNDCLTRQGIEIDNVAEFGNSWKVGGTMCPDANTEPDVIRPCDLVTPRSTQANTLCNIIHDDVFAPCHVEIDPDYYFDKCKDDTCRCEAGYTCFCDAVAYYSMLCAKAGHVINWRDDELLQGICDVSCPMGKTYQECGSSCGRTCREIAEPDHLCGDDCVPGCNCPPGMFEDQDGNCVPIRHCPCYFEGRFLHAGSQYQPLGSTRDCQCQNGEVICTSTVDEPETCPEGQEYIDCGEEQHAGTSGAACQPTCEMLGQESLCLPFTPCMSGCVCPPNLVKDGDRCVVPDDCRCRYGGKWYERDESVVKDCNTCYCTRGAWNCTEKQCDGYCIAYGDPHFGSFDGKKFRFQGDCGYVMATDHCHNQTGTYRVVAENVPCGSTGTTCSKSITITLQLLEIVLERDKEPYTRAVSGSMIGFTSFPWRIFYIGFFTIVQVDIGLTVIWDRGTRIMIKLSPHHQGKVCGMCGNFDNNMNNDFLTRTGELVSNGIRFGNSWKISSTCPDQERAISPCERNPHREPWARRHCGIIMNHELFGACHSVINPKDFYEACIYDTCGCDSGGDCECFCTVVAEFAHQCSRYGFHVRWRTQEICPTQCEDLNVDDECEWHYDPCGTACPPTCEDPWPGHCDLGCFEGCHPRCQPGEVLFGHRCIPVEECPIPTTTAAPTTTEAPTTAAPETTVCAPVCEWGPWIDLHCPETVCEYGDQSLGLSCYLLVPPDDSDTYQQATIYCDALGGTVVVYSSMDEAGFIMEQFGSDTFYVGATWEMYLNKWVWDNDNFGNDILERLDAPDGSMMEPCLVSMNGQLMAASCDIARQFICETTGTPGPESEDDDTAREAGYDICEEPMGIECLNVDTGEILLDGQMSLDDGTYCSLEDGATCLYNCPNYQVRYQCCYAMDICTTPGPTTTTAPPTTTTAPPTTTTAPPTTTTAPPTTTTPPPTTTTEAPPPPTTTTEAPPPPTTTTEAPPPPPTTTTTTAPPPPPPTTTTAPPPPPPPPPPTTTTAPPPPPPPPPPTTTAPPPPPPPPPPTTTTAPPPPPPPPPPTTTAPPPPPPPPPPTTTTAPPPPPPPPPPPTTTAPLHHLHLHHQQLQLPLHHLHLHHQQLQLPLHHLHLHHQQLQLVLLPPQYVHLIVNGLPG
ncbi:mucin-5AC-like [Branchiostoma floridae x Branchiostoma belcheri]